MAYKYDRAIVLLLLVFLLNSIGNQVLRFHPLLYTQRQQLADSMNGP